MALTDGQRQIAARAWIENAFVRANVTANLTYADIKAAIDTIDGDYDATLNAAVTAYGGSTTILNAFLASLPEPFKSTANAGQKALAFTYVAMARGGLI